MMRRAVVVAFALCSSLPAFADEATARRDFDAGERAYNLGDFNKAVELFKKAYEEWPEPAFLFNIAQTYRQAGDCKQALFFYKRFLALKQTDTKKPIKPELKREVEQRIVELEECMRRELANKPPDQLDNGATSAGTSASSSGTNAANAANAANTANTANTTTQPGATPANTTTGTSTSSTASADPRSDEGEEDEGEEETPSAPTGNPTRITARVLGGAGKLGAGDLDVPVQFFGTIVGGYPLTVADKVQIELGAAISFTPVPYTTTMNEQGTGSLVGIAANVGARLALMPKLAARVEAGAGVSVFSGLETMGNPFTAGGVAATGPLSTFLARAALSADFAVTPNVVITAMPIAFAYAPAPSGFQSAISSLTTLSFCVGVGYQR